MKASWQTGHSQASQCLGITELLLLLCQRLRAEPDGTANDKKMGSLLLLGCLVDSIHHLFLNFIH